MAKPNETDPVGQNDTGTGQRSVGDLWGLFASSELVSGAWRGVPWEDLPPELQAEFTDLSARWWHYRENGRSLRTDGRRVEWLDREGYW